MLGVVHNHGVPRPSQRHVECPGNQLGCRVTHRPGQRHDLLVFLQKVTGRAPNPLPVAGSERLELLSVQPALNRAQQKVTQLASKAHHRQCRAQLRRPAPPAILGVPLQQLADDRVLLRARNQAQLFLLLPQHGKRQGVHGAHHRAVGNKVSISEPLRNLRPDPRGGLLRIRQEQDALRVRLPLRRRHKRIDEKAGHPRTRLAGYLP